MVSFLKRLFSSRKNIRLTSKQIDYYQREGYLVLRDVFTANDFDLLEGEIESLWKNASADNSPLVIDFCEGPYVGQRMYLKDAPEGSRCHSHKLNDLFLESSLYRNLCLQPRLVGVLNQLLEQAPVVINSLCFQKGSQQDDHFDTYFMPPPTEGNLVVTSICLEDIHPDAGPVQYYPGSHKIPAYEFTNGGTYVRNANERENAHDYIHGKLNELGLKAKTFLGKKGDVLIWHGQLYHGGRPIQNHNLTRKSIVTHYWADSDVCEPDRSMHTSGGYYLQRSHQPVPAKT